MGHGSSPILFRSRVAALVLILADITALLSSIAISLLLRFDGLSLSSIYDQYLKAHLHSLPLVTAVYLAAFSAFHLYRCAWRFAGLEMLWGIIYANSVGLAGLIVIQLFVDAGTFPRSVLAILWMATIVSTGGVRVLLRILAVARRYGRYSIQTIWRGAQCKRVVILGAGTDGARILRAIREDPSLRYEVIGLLDEDPNKKGVYVSNVKVLGPPYLLKRLAAEGTIDEVIVALPETSSQRVRECILECRTRRIPVKVVPQVRDVLTGKTSLPLVDFSVEDLLRRPIADTNVAVIGGYLTGKRVLVTGAGGSIGSELCRQIASLDPASLILLGHGENSIHQIHQELLCDYPHLSSRIHYVIASISNASRINQAFDHYRPQVVFHAAAHKHVPMMETNEQEAVYNNVIGTYHIAEACGRIEVERIVLISTDKAANPSCIMGATKWICEEILRASASLRPQTAHITVRFGNVLGSRGSVVPVFCEQIKRGGPVTVTHPEMTRYFMTIPEAVRLVLEAGAVGESGELYILDMGDPVRITDLAEDMIRLCGLEPGVDVEIRFTGMRPGEKLHEQLTSVKECVQKTPWSGLSLVHRPEYYSPSEIFDNLRRLEHAANCGSPAEIRAILSEMVPGIRLSEAATSRPELQHTRA